MIQIINILLACSIWEKPALAHHGGDHHADKPVETSSVQVVNEHYLRDVKPIFEKKCADCHGAQTIYPGYYKIPGVGYLMDRDVAEGHEHLDFSKDFPFGGHGSTTDTFKSLKEDVSEGDMPPWTYRLMHRGSALTPVEKETILHWISDSEKTLGIKTSD